MPCTFDTLKVEVLPEGGKGRAKRKRRHRKVGSEGSVEQTCGPMLEHRIVSPPSRTSEPMIAKSTIGVGC